MWRCILQARITAYALRLKELGLQHLMVLSNDAKSMHKAERDLETKILFDEAEDNPVPLDIGDLSTYPEEYEEDEINTAAADLMDHRDVVGEPEQTVIWLPSRDPNSTMDAQMIEMETQHALAVEQITVIRSCIGEKSVLIQIRVRRDKNLGQHWKGRAWQDINKAHATMVAALATYKRCRTALDRLPSNLDGIDAARKTLRAIHKDDLKELKDVTVANRVTQKNDKIAWFWGMLAEHQGEEQYFEEGDLAGSFSNIIN
jgi:hypothetical protein